MSTGSQDFLEEIERLQQMVNNKDEAHAKDVAILEEMVHTQMMRSAELEATVERLRRLDGQRSRRSLDPGANPTPRAASPTEKDGHSPSPGWRRPTEEALMAELEASNTAGTGDSPEGPRVSVMSTMTAFDEVRVLPHQPGSPLTGGTGESLIRDSQSCEEEALTEMTARHNMELTKLVAEMRQREQALRTLQAQTDASHVSEMQDQQEQLSVLSARCAELEASLATEQKVKAEYQTELAALRGTIAQMTVAAENKTHAIRQLEESVAVRNALMCNQARRIELREQEHRLQITLLQAALFRFSGSEATGKAECMSNLEEIVDTMKHSERDYHFQRVASEAAAAAARASGSSERVRLVELEASNAVLEAAARKMRERSSELMRLEEQAVAQAAVRGRPEGTAIGVVRSVSQGSCKATEPEVVSGVPTMKSQLSSLTLRSIRTADDAAGSRPSRSPIRNLSPKPRHLVAIVGTEHLSPGVPKEDPSSAIMPSVWTPQGGGSGIVPSSPVQRSATETLDGGLAIQSPPPSRSGAGHVGSPPIRSVTSAATPMLFPPGAATASSGGSPRLLTRATSPGAAAHRSLTRERTGSGPTAPSLGNLVNSPTNMSVRAFPAATSPQARPASNQSGSVVIGQSGSVVIAMNQINQQPAPAARIAAVTPLAGGSIPLQTTASPLRMGSAVISAASPSKKLELPAGATVATTAAAVAKKGPEGATSLGSAVIPSNRKPPAQVAGVGISNQLQQACQASLVTLVQTARSTATSVVIPAQTATEPPRG